MRSIDIAWAGTASAGAERMVGAPDAHTVIIGLHVPSATVSGFVGRRYDGLAELLAGAVKGDRVTPAMLASADVIAFDHNGDEAAPSGGFESCDWVFADGAHTLAVPWDDRVDDAGVPVPRDAHVIANGTLVGRPFADFFDVPDADLMAENPSGGTPLGVRIGFLLFRIRPEIDPSSPGLTVTVKQSGRPDVDSVGILRHHQTVRITTRELSYPLFKVPGVTALAMDGSLSPALTMSAGTFAYWSGEGSLAFTFGVDAMGRVDYDRALDGFLGGRGTSELVVRGIAVTLNTGGLLQELHPLDVYGPITPLSPGRVHRLNLVPSSRYTFRCGPVPGTVLHLALTSGGALVPT
jgi:hypothetical protein